MDPSNCILLYTFHHNICISKKEISFSTHINWTTLNDFKNYVQPNKLKMKYYDDEGELISLTKQEDFVIFRELILDKQFLNNQVVVLAYDGLLDGKRFTSCEKILELKAGEEVKGSLKPDNFMGSAQNSDSTKYKVDDDSSSSSTSSSSIAIKRRKPATERNKMLKTNRYAAELKKELNYLPGSEVFDGQTILKRWRIKNIGSKKWKNNSVKCVLLPSKYSDWVNHLPLKVPICFADQKVDIEMEITIQGRWEEGSDVGSTEIDLTWLIYKDSLVSKRIDNFKDYILTQLQLCITVKRKIGDGDSVMDTQNELRKHLSESSIERIDKEFSIVDMSEEERDYNKNRTEGLVNSIPNEGRLMRNDSGNIDIDLLDIPPGDDFQISDFNSPDHFITVEHDDAARSNNIVYDPSKAPLSHSDKMASVDTTPVVHEIINDVANANTADVVKEGMPPIDIDEVTVLTNNEEIINSKYDEEMIVSENNVNESNLSSNEEMVRLSNKDSEIHLDSCEQEITVERNNSGRCRGNEVVFVTNSDDIADHDENEGGNVMSTDEGRGTRNEGLVVTMSNDTDQECVTHNEDIIIIPDNDEVICINNVVEIPVMPTDNVRRNSLDCGRVDSNETHEYTNISRNIGLPSIDCTMGQDSEMRNIRGGPENENNENDAQVDQFGDRSQSGEAIDILRSSSNDRPEHGEPQLNTNTGEGFNRDLINNQSHQIDNNSSHTPRQIPVDSIRNEFPTTQTNDNTFMPYIPGKPYIYQNQHLPYVPGVGTGWTNGQTNVANIPSQVPPSINPYYRPPNNNIPYYPTAYNYQPITTAYYQPPRYQPGNMYPNLNAMPLNCHQVRQGNNDVVSNLRQQGHLYDHMNESNTIQCAPNGQHYVTSQNLAYLKSMGFNDTNRLTQLLMKHNNNLDKVLGELIP